MPPTAMAAAALREDNWRVHHLGADMPGDELVRFCHEHDVDLAVLTVTTTDAARSAAETATRLEREGVRSLVGRPGATSTSSSGSPVPAEPRPARVRRSAPGAAGDAPGRPDPHVDAGRPQQMWWAVRRGKAGGGDEPLVEVHHLGVVEGPSRMAHRGVPEPASPTGGHESPSRGQELDGVVGLDRRAGAHDHRGRRRERRAGPAALDPCRDDIGDPDVVGAPVAVRQR